MRNQECERVCTHQLHKRLFECLGFLLLQVSLTAPFCLGTDSICRGCTNVQHLISDVIEKGIKETHDDVYHHTARVDGVIRNGIKEVKENENTTKITLERVGRMPMPIDILVEYTDGSQELFYIPFRMMCFEKPNPNRDTKRTVLDDWTWANPVYDFVISSNKAKIKK